jgi:hypothetical protein
MSARMTREEFGAAWNSGDADLVTSFFQKMVFIMLRWDPMTWQKLFWQRANSSWCSGFLRSLSGGGKFENLKVAVAGDIGTFEWDFVSTDPTGQIVRTAGCDLLQFVGDKVAVKNAIRKQRA